MIQVIVIKAGHDVGLRVPALLNLGDGSLINDHGLPLLVVLAAHHCRVGHLLQVDLQGGGAALPRITSRSGGRQIVVQLDLDLLVALVEDQVTRVRDRLVPLDLLENPLVEQALFRWRALPVSLDHLFLEFAPLAQLVLIIRLLLLIFVILVLILVNLHLL